MLNLIMNIFSFTNEFYENLIMYRRAPYRCTYFCNPFQITDVRCIATKRLQVLKSFSKSRQATIEARDVNGTNIFRPTDQPRGVG